MYKNIKITYLKNLLSKMIDYLCKYYFHLIKLVKLNLIFS